MSLEVERAKAAVGALRRRQQQHADLAKTEAEIWTDPSAHGVMPLELIRRELMRMAALLIIQTDQARDGPYAGAILARNGGNINGLVTALRMMGNADWVSYNTAWAESTIAELGPPMSGGVAWPEWPGEVMSHKRREGA